MDERTAHRLREMKAEVFKALGHPVRVAIVDCLAEGARCVCEITEVVGAERSNVSRHLAIMVKAGILASRKEGLQVFYRLRTPCLMNVFPCVERALREQIQEDSAVLSSA